MIKAVIFDCFGVLTTDLWKEFVATLPEDQKQPARDLNRQYDSGFLSRPEFVQKIVKLTGKQPNVFELTLDNVAEVNKNFDLLSYITQLKKDYKLGIISNIASNWIRETFLTPEEVKLFDTMILSFEVHMTKPDPRMFRLAAERLGVEPEECVLVDDIEAYCQAAQQEGMKAVVYQNFEQMKPELEKILAKD